MLNKKVKGYFTIGSVGLHLVSGIIVGLLIGYFLDKVFNTGYVLTIVFFFLGISTGFYNMYKDVTKYIQKEERKKDQSFL